MNNPKPLQATILGIHDGHNASACLVKDGRVIAALSEERLTNIKNFTGFPAQAIDRIIKFTKTDPSAISGVAVSSLIRTGDPLAPANFWTTGLEMVSPLLDSHAFSAAYVKFFHLFRSTSQLHQVLNHSGISAPISFIEHHLSHAASAYFQRPFSQPALILTLDGAGDGLSATVSIGRGLEIKRLASTTHYHSLSNNLYSEITGYLGLKRWEHEYKVMGLAPYGKSGLLKSRLEPIIRLHPDHPLEFQNTSGRYLRRLQPLYQKLFQEQRFDNISAATQETFEELVTAWVKQAIDRTGIHRIVTAGGAFLNVKANQLIRELPQVSESFFYPAADDAGTAVGAALWTYYAAVRKSGLTVRHHPLENLYLGLEYSPAEIKTEIRDFSSRFHLRCTRPRDLPKTLAGLIAAGQIVAVFSGRDEFGPRALGNRSILADARSTDVIRRLNFAIKMRDFWMPFAPVVIEADASKYFVNFRPSRYMIESFASKPKASEIVAGLHPFDLSGRPQSVSEYHPDYYRLLLEYKRLTGVSGLINTSFNLHGFPIVGSPRRALETLIDSGLNYLAIGPFLVSKL